MTNNSIDKSNLSTLAFFFDFDGTLVDIAATPNDVVVPNELHYIIQELILKCDGAVAIISGRPVTELDKYLKTNIPLAGLHGAEIKISNDLLSPLINENFLLTKEYIIAKSENYPDLLIEDKGVCIAVHYRQAPHLKNKVLEIVTHALHQYCSNSHEIQLGKKVVEIKPKKFNKAVALNYFMSLPNFKGKIPVCFGDDITDEPMLEAALKHNGYAYKIGLEENGTKWQYISTPNLLRHYLINLIKEQE